VDTFLEVLERGVDALGTDTFYSELELGLREALSLDFVVISFTPREGHGCPSVLIESATKAYGSAMRNWEDNSYELYPSYKAIKSGKILATHTMGELQKQLGHMGAQANFDKHVITPSPVEDMGFRVNGFAPNLSIAVSFLSMPDSNEIVSVNVSRENTLTRKGFIESELRQLNQIRWFINQAFLKHWQY
jgi:hypothetical protein